MSESDGTGRQQAPVLATLPEVADALDVVVTRVHQYLRDGELVAVRGEDGVRRVPALLIMDGEIVRGASGVFTLLRDAGFSDEEIVDWLHREDDSLPGSPLEALRDNRGTKVKRRAQVAGY